MAGAEMGMTVSDYANMIVAAGVIGTAIWGIIRGYNRMEQSSIRNGEKIDELSHGFKEYTNHSQEEYKELRQEIMVLKLAYEGIERELTQYRTALLREGLLPITVVEKTVVEKAK